MTISYSHFFEDIWLNRVFEKQQVGFYINIWANDPDTCSVTKLFYERGWRGINVEPMPSVYEKLAVKRPRDINLQICIGSQKGMVEFYCDTLSVDKEWGYLKDNDLKDNRKTIFVQMDTLANICSEYLPNATEIDFLAIDAEGQEENIIKSADWLKYRPRVLVIEAIQPHRLMRNTLTDAENANWECWEYYILDAGYLFAQFDGINRYYVRADEADLLHCFTIPVHPDLDGFVKAFSTGAAVRGALYQARDALYLYFIDMLRLCPKLYSLLRSVYRNIKNIFR